MQLNVETCGSGYIVAHIGLTDQARAYLAEQLQKDDVWPQVSFGRQSLPEETASAGEWKDDVCEGVELVRTFESLDSINNSLGADKTS